MNILGTMHNIKFSDTDSSLKLPHQLFLETLFEAPSLICFLTS